MKKPTWNQRREELIADMRRFHAMDNSDPERQRLIEEAIKRQRYALEKEDLDALPDWVKNGRENRKQKMAAIKASEPTWRSIQSKIDDEIGQRTDIQLWPGASAELTSVRYDIWYQTDSALQDAKDSGETARLESIIEAAVASLSSARTTVCFHSVQHVKEKWGGNLREYLG